MPEIGDLIIENVDEKGAIQVSTSEEKYVGIVTEIHLDKYGHHRNVMIEWSQSSPPEYNEAWGYCGTNIHNLYSRFSIVRHGILF